MTRKFILNMALGAIGLLCDKQTMARNTPMDALVHREQQQHAFTAIANLWRPDAQYKVADVAQEASDATFFVVDAAALSNIVARHNRDIQLTIPKGDGSSYVIDLVQYNFLTPDFKVQTVAGSTLSNFNFTPGVFYRGTVHGIPNSVASFSFFDDELYGLFSIPNVGNIVIGRNKLAGATNKQHYVMYNDADMKVQPYGGCAADDLPQTNIHKKDLAAVAGRGQYSSCRRFAAYLQCDYQTFLDAGSDAGHVTNYFTATFNSVTTLYQNEGIYVALKTLNINTASDVYQTVDSSSLDFLNEFGLETQNNMQGADIAMLVTSRYGARLGGVAWIGTLCYPYFTQQDNSSPSGLDYVGAFAFVNTDYATLVALPTFSWDVEAMTHEFGHTFGSPHTHNCTAWPGGPIDGCYTLEGNCAEPMPQYPPNGGTIMSYCQFVSSVGINLSNGFGHYPGDTIRYGANNATCGSMTLVTAPETVADSVVLANRECTDPSGITYYWNDNNTADATDDRVALMIKKNGADIGTTDSTGFSVMSGTDLGYGDGTGIFMNLPSSASTSGVGTLNYAFRRYWQLSATATPTANMEVIFPYTSTDVNNASASISTHPTSDANLFMYMVPPTTSPDPAAGQIGVATSNFTIYKFGTTPSILQWSETISGSNSYAHMLTNARQIGGGAFMSNNSLAVTQIIVNGTPLTIFPNPAHDSWTIYIPGTAGSDMQLQLYTTEGKVLQQQILHAGTNNSVNATQLPAGIYYYRITGNGTATGNLLKQ